MTLKAWFPPGDTFLEIKIKYYLFPGDSDIFKAMFLYRPITLYRQLIPTKLILSSNFFRENKKLASFRALLTGPVAAPDTSTSFSFVRRLESNFLKC